MVQKTVEIISLGTMADLDPDESDSIAENSGSLVGMTFGSQASPLYQQLDYLTLDDPDADGVTYSNDFGYAPEDVIFDGTASGIDSVIEYYVNITFNDGSTVPAQIVLIQDVSGRVFLAPFLEGLAENDVLNDGGIRSIKVTGVVDDTFDGAFVDREADAFVVCFLEGTEISCLGRNAPVETLKAGDLVDTLDHGPQPVQWIAQERVEPKPRTFPIRFRKGSLGGDFPKRDLFLSPQHRVMVQSPIAARMFGQSQVFVPAKRMTDLPGASEKSSEEVLSYWHAMLKRHEVIFAEGAPVESFLPGPMAMAGLSADNRRDLMARHPLLRFTTQDAKPARPCISGQAARNLIKRLRRNGRYPFEPQALPEIRAAC